MGFDRTLHERQPPVRCQYDRPAVRRDRSDYCTMKVTLALDLVSGKPSLIDATLACCCAGLGRFADEDHERCTDTLT